MCFSRKSLRRLRLIYIIFHSTFFFFLFLLFPSLLKNGINKGKEVNLLGTLLFSFKFPISFGISHYFYLRFSFFQVTILKMSISLLLSIFEIQRHKISNYFSLIFPSHLCLYVRTGAVLRREIFNSE